MKINTYFGLLLISILFASCSQKPKPTFTEADVALIPKPLKLELGKSSFQVTSNTKIALTDESQQKAVNFLKGIFNTAAGYNLELINAEVPEAIVFEKTEGLKKGAYKLEVSPFLVKISASEETGYFNAVQTIRQLLPITIESKEKVDENWFIPSIIIEDEPRFEWRGMHMDFSRHFFNINEVKDFLDYMALYKLNTYHMHLTDDQGWRIEIKKYPLLTEKGAWRTPNNQDTLCIERAVENKLYTIDESNFKNINGEKKYGGFFTQEQIKEIVAYADERCITVIPEIDMPGHFKAAMDNYPFLSCTGESGWDTVFTYPACLGKETTYEFMENILNEVVDLFPADYVHIGGDEVNIKTWKESPLCQKVIKENGLKDEHELQAFFNRRIEKFLQSKGKQLMGWDEIVTGGLTKDAAVMWWRGWRPEAPKIAAENGNKVVITPTDAYYFDYLNEGNTLEKVYNYEPIPKDFTIEEASNVLGIQANLWSERIPSFKRLQYQAFPRILAVAENAWVAQEKDFEQFNKRVENQYNRLDVLEVYYYIPAVKGLNKEIAFVDKTEITLDLSYPLENVDIYYTLNGDVPDKNAIKYVTPFTVKDTGVIKARAYKKDIFNDILSAKIIQKTYHEALNVLPKNKGLNRKTYKTSVKEVNDFKANGTYKSVAVDSISLPEKYQENKNFAFKFEGYFKAEKDGIYEFETRSDGGDLLSINEELIVDNSGWHGPRKRYGKIALKQGWHAISIKYRPSHIPRVIEVKYALQGKELQPLKSDVTAY